MNQAIFIGLFGKILTEEAFMIETANKNTQNHPGPSVVQIYPQLPLIYRPLLKHIKTLRALDGI